VAIRFSILIRDFGHTSACLLIYVLRSTRAGHLMGCYSLTASGRGDEAAPSLGARLSACLHFGFIRLVPVNLA
jgi:hypothetical protein